MDFSFTDEQKSFRDEVIRFARKELNDDVPFRDQTQAFSRDLWVRHCSGIRRFVFHLKIRHTDGEVSGSLAAVLFA